MGNESSAKGLDLGPNHSATASEKESKLNFYPVDIDYLRIKVRYEEDLYTLQDGRYVLLRRKNIPMSFEDKEALKKIKQKYLYIKTDSVRSYHRFLESNLGDVLDNKSVAPEKKATVLYQCASSLTEEMFESPHRDENARRSHEMVRNTIKFLATGTDAFIKLVSFCSTDSLIYTHSVNVMVYTLRLAYKVGIKDRILLQKIGAGALLHDIGKSKIDKKILLKPGPLDAEEWIEMRRHPNYGYEIIKDSSHISSLSAEMVLNHHEKLDGSGYPSKRTIRDIDNYSQIVSICECYIGMITDWAHGEGMSSMQAFQIITHNLNTQFNMDYVVKLIKLLKVK